MECFDIFISAIKRPATRLSYIRSIEKFKDHCKIESYCDFKKMDTRDLKSFLVSYIESWKGLSYSSCNAYLSAIELFLDMNEINYPKRVIRKLLPNNDRKPGGGLPYTTEEIRSMLTATTKLRTKALIHFFASVGGRPGILTDPVVTVGDLLDMPDGCRGVLFYKGSKEEYWGFLTPEANKALDKYLKSRRLNGEILNNDSALFTVIDGTPMNYRAMYEIFQGLMKQAGIERKKTDKRFNKAMFTGFRKRFNTILKIDNSINSNIAEKLMAHKKGLDNVYLKPTIDECFNEFKKAIREITIDDTMRQELTISAQEKEIIRSDILQEQITNLVKKNEDLQKQINTLNDVSGWKIVETQID